MSDVVTQHQMDDRARTILGSKDGLEVHPLARHLALETEFPESECLKILEVAARERRSQIFAAADLKELGLQ